ncbi:hypothetical protein NDU88_001883 [Pleurodeles waltl]|uniref:Uncharacterized protein n=1 Tax=Pleurodeles waltl TaxID=8319 RepID=A0AAV7P540_PLEWA|nr:hypothetical protein NDU88_001883 [Pleurodeles waltl]
MHKRHLTTPIASTLRQPEAVNIKGLAHGHSKKEHAHHHMAGYDDQAEELYYMDDSVGSFDQDLVYALDAGVRHLVNQALAQAIQPIKHHLLGLVDQQAWAAPVSASTMGDPS